MDNLTHSLTGLALSRAGLNQLSPNSTTLLVLSANAPDLDIIAAFRGALPYLEAHRGYSHSLLGLPVMAALCVFVTAGIFRRRLPWTRAFVIASIGIASHLLLDWTNSYGIRLLLPFSSSWFYADLNALYDWAIWAVLLFAAIWPVFASLVSSEIGSKRSKGRGLALAALGFFVLFDIGRAIAHGRAVSQLQARLYDGAPPLGTAAFPNSLNPLVWRAVVETESSVRLLTANVAGQLDAESGKIFYKPALDDSTLLKLKNTEPFRFFSYFSRYPVWSIQDVNDDRRRRRVEVSDLRFGSPGEGAFHCVALLDNQGMVLLSQFTYGSGAEIGWGKNPPQLSRAEYLSSDRESLGMGRYRILQGLGVAAPQRDD